MDDLLDDFYEEIKDIFTQMTLDLEVLSSGDANVDTINSLFRGLHTIKGGCGMFSFTRTQATAHELENFLDKARVNPEIYDHDFVQSGVDQVEELFNYIMENNSEPSTDEVPDMGEDSSKSETVIEEQTEEQGVKVGADYPEYVKDFTNSFEEWVEDLQSKSTRFFEIELPDAQVDTFSKKLGKKDMIKVANSESKNGLQKILFILSPESFEKADPIYNKLKKTSSFREYFNEPVEEIKEEVIKEPIKEEVSVEVATPKKEVEKKTEQPEKTKSAPKVKQEMLRIPLRQVNSILNNIWEIFLIRNQIDYMFNKNKTLFAKHPEVMQEWEVLDNALSLNIHEAENSAMGMRLSSVSPLFQKMAKTIRSYLRNNDKVINFEKEGEDIELDKKVIDALGEPLIHLIRNAMDHGVETPDVRIKAGKPEEGTIKLSAKATSDKVKIILTDDGNGIDAQKILEIANKKGLNIEHVKTDDDALKLIFAPGFSTAEVVSDVSGRGVGMDAVRQSVLALGGEIFIETEVGHGSTFTIELPVSMSVISSLLLDINDQVYAVAISNILEINRSEKLDIKINNNEQFYFFRNEYIPCYNLQEIYHKGQKQEPEVTESESNDEFHTRMLLDEDSRDTPQRTICVIEVGNELIAFEVSKVLQHINLVIKETNKYFDNQDEISGVSILATGAPIFFLNTERILKNIKQKNKGADNVAA